MSERSHHHNPAAHSRLRPTHAKRGGPSLTIGHIQLRTPRFQSPPCLGSGGYRIAGSRRLPSFLEKRDRRERSFLIEKAHSARRLPPQRHRVRALRPNKRRNNRVCHRVSNNALLVLAMINKGKLYSYQNARFFKQTSQ